MNTTVYFPCRRLDWIDIQLASLSRSLEPLSSGDALHMSMSSQSHPISRRIAEIPSILFAGPENKWRALRASCLIFTNLAPGGGLPMIVPTSFVIPWGAWHHLTSVTFPFFDLVFVPLPLPFVFASLPFFPLPGHDVNACPGSPQLLQACALEEGHGNWHLPEL
jgi:hypothetical protein